MNTDTNNTKRLNLKKYIPTANIINRYYNGRTVVLLGDSESLRILLKQEYNIEVNLFTTRVKEKVCENVVPLRKLKNKSSDYYIVIPLLPENEELKKTLNSFGYKEFKDYVFTMHKKVVIPAQSGEYRDEYGNYIVCKGCQVSLAENVGNTTIIADKSVKFKQGCIMMVGSSNCTVNIQKDCKFGQDFKIILWSGAKLTIGEHSSFGHNGGMVIHHDHEIVIGKDIMFANEVKVYAGDGHAIFDVVTGKRKNPVPDRESNPVVEFKDHVWVGIRSIVLGNKKTVIGQSCIIGAGSVVKGVFPNNCIIAGNPAKIVRKNATWNRNNTSENIFDCGEENICLTQE